MPLVVQYQVPLKDDKKRELYCSNWPKYWTPEEATAQTVMFRELRIRKAFRNSFLGKTPVSMDEKIEEKLSNTIDFFRSVIT
ncbi:MAG: hypothetical protein AB1330_13435 [Bacillota bacterium]